MAESGSGARADPVAGTGSTAGTGPAGTGPTDGAGAPVAVGATGRHGVVAAGPSPSADTGPRSAGGPEDGPQPRPVATADPPAQVPAEPDDAAGTGPAGRWPVRRWAVRVITGAVVMLVLVVGATAFRVWEVARIDDRRPVDAVVVLGAAQYDGDPSAIFAARLRHAAALYRDGIAPRIVTTGGGRVGDDFTEAAAGKRYLVGQGVPASAVVAVGVGSDTLGSMRAVAARAAADGWDTALLVSDPWHSLRARQMARDSGLVAWTSPTRSGPVVQTRETQFRYIVRETAAMLYYRLTHTSVDTETTGVG